MTPHHRIRPVSLSAWLLAAALGACEVPPGGRTAAPVDAEASHREMIDRLEAMRREAKESNPFFGESRYGVVRGRIEALTPGAPPRERFPLLLEAAQLAQNLGREREAIRWLEAARPLAAGALPAYATVSFRLGLAYLRLAETENCCSRHSPDSCILPLTGGALHEVTEGSTRAIGHFTEVLRSAGRDSVEYHRARWLLNVAHMTLGTFPDDVPPEHRLDPRRFEKESGFPRLRNVAAGLGVNSFGCAGGAVVDDFDGDDDLDILVSNYDPAGQLRYFANEREAGFVERTAEANLLGITGGLNLVQADYDGDGHLDILVLRGGWFHSYGQHPNSLLRNDGTGRFLDVAAAAGLVGPDLPTQTASWGDFDLDGDLDLYVGNESSPDFAAPSQLFRNEGNGRFTDVAPRAGVTNDRYAKGVIWGDYDGDRWPDLYVSNFGSANRLYRNERDGTFTDVAVEAGVSEPKAGFPCWFWDYDDDGRLDLAAFAFDAHIDDLSRIYAGEKSEAQLPRMYRNLGGSFEDRAPALGLTAPSAPMGSNFGDLDGDGRLDFYLGTGWPNFYDVMPNLLFLNHGTFRDATMASGLANLQKGHAVCFADFDHDGDLDVFEQMGGAFPGDRYFDALYESPGFGNDWLVLHLIGTESNRSAIGARIRVRYTSGGDARNAYRWVNSGGTFGGSPLRQHIGLGACDGIESVEIDWPAGTRQTFRDLQRNRMYRIRESDRVPMEVPYEPIPLVVGS